MTTSPFNNLSLGTSGRLRRRSPASTSMMSTTTEDDDEDDTSPLPNLKTANSADQHHQRSPETTTAGFDGRISLHDDKCSPSCTNRTCHSRLCPPDNCNLSCHCCTKDAASVQHEWREVASGKHRSSTAVSPTFSCQLDSFNLSSPLSSPCQRHHHYHPHYHSHQQTSCDLQDNLSSALYLPVTTTSRPPRQNTNWTLSSTSNSSSDSIAHYHSLMPSSTSSCTTLRYHSPSSSPLLSSSSLSPFYRVLLCLVTLLALILSDHRVASDRNRFYHISALCLRERVHPLYKKIDGAVISSKSENNLDCTITFQTDTILQKFMIRFEKLALDCNDHLYIYDGAHTHGNHKAHLSCRSTRAEVGTIYTQGNFLTLHYTTDAYSKADNGFRLIITAYKDSKNHCREHRCSNQFCISGDLICDGVNHCGDNSDETYYANCPEFEEADTIIGLDPNFFIACVVLVFVLCLACVLSVSFCLCRRERLLQRQQQRIALQQQYSGSPGGQLMIDPSMGGGGLMMGHTGATPILQHNNNSYNSKLDGCTMITSLDGYGATRMNGGLVNSFTHTTLPPNHMGGANFATLPHLHNHNHVAGQQQAQQQQTVATSGGGHAHVRFGTLPVRGGGGEKPPPAYPGNYFNGGGGGQGPNGGIPMVPVNGGPAGGMLNGNGILANGSNGGLVNMHTPPHSAANAVQTQVIYTAK